MRLIDAESLDSVPLECKADAMNAIRNAPTIDAVPVVRCEDCIHWGKMDGNDENKRYFCYVDGMWCKPARRKNDFCSYGERKEGAD